MLNNLPSAHWTDTGDVTFSTTENVRLLVFWVILMSPGKVCIYIPLYVHESLMSCRVFIWRCKQSLNKPAVHREYYFIITSAKLYNFHTWGQSCDQKPTPLKMLP